MRQNKMKEGWAESSILQLRKLEENSERWNWQSMATQNKQMLEAEVGVLLINRDFTQENNIGSAVGSSGIITSGFLL